MVNVFFNLIFQTITPNLYKFTEMFDNFKDYDIILNSFNNDIEINDPIKILQLYLSNKFIQPEKKRHILNTFCRAQRMYYFFKGFYRNHCFKKMSSELNDTSLCLVPFRELTDKYIIKLREDDTIYKFYIFDITKIIESSLTKTNALIENPRWPKNPYTNINFSVENLINIYFFLKKHNLIISNNFKHLFDCYFNLDLFHAKNQNELRCTSIKNYTKEMSDLDKYLFIINALYEYKEYWPNLQIDMRYPKTTIVDLFENELIMYLMAKYCFCPHFRALKKKNFIKQIKHIKKNNFFLGRVFKFNSRPKKSENESYIPIHVNTNTFKNILDDDVTNELILEYAAKPTISESYFIYNTFDLN